MKLPQKNDGKTKAKPAKVKKGKTSKKKNKNHGGAREGAGRPSLYPGKDLDRHATAYFTKDGWKKLADIQKILTKRHEDKMQSVSASDAIEEGIHRLHRELTRPR